MAHHVIEIYENEDAGELEVFCKTNSIFDAETFDAEDAADADNFASEWLYLITAESSDTAAVTWSGYAPGWFVARDTRKK